MMWILSLQLTVGGAWATDVGEAEHIRLSGEIAQLAKRQVWTGVEKRLAEMTTLGVEMNYEDLIHGAYAARALGNAESAYNRLKLAAKMKGTREVVDWLYAIDANYGLVQLSASPPRGVALVPAELPFDPDQRICVDASVERVRKEGVFSGLLPRGAYTFAGQAFTVEPGISVRIEVRPKMKKTEGERITVTTSPVTDGAGATTTP